MGLVEFLDAQPNGIGAMIGGLIEANLGSHPERAKLLRPPAVVWITARDAGVSTTIHLSPNRVTVSNGQVGKPAVAITTDSETLTELSSVPLRLGFPDSLKPEGRAATKKLFNGKLTVKGLLLHPGVVSRVNRLLSVL